jgi:hypothetical protein
MLIRPATEKPEKLRSASLIGTSLMLAKRHTMNP